MQTATEILEAAESKGVALRVHAGGLRVRGRSGITPDLDAAIRARKAEIIAELERRAAAPARPWAWVVLHSEALGEDIVVVSDERHLALAAKERPGLAVFIAAELEELARSVGKPGYEDLLRTVVVAKREFPGSTVVPPLQPPAFAPAEEDRHAE